MDGRHASRVRPFRLYLLSSALLFGVLALPGTSFATEVVNGFIDGLTEGLTAQDFPGLAAVFDDDDARARVAQTLTDNMPRAMFLLLPVVSMLVGLVVSQPVTQFGDPSNVGPARSLPDIRLASHTPSVRLPRRHSQVLDCLPSRSGRHIVACLVLAQGL